MRADAAADHHVRTGGVGVVAVTRTCSIVRRLYVSVRHMQRAHSMHGQVLSYCSQSEGGQLGAGVVLATSQPHCMWCSIVYNMS